MAGIPAFSIGPDGEVRTARMASRPARIREGLKMESPPPPWGVPPMTPPVPTWILFLFFFFAGDA